MSCDHAQCVVLEGSRGLLKVYSSPPPSSQVFFTCRPTPQGTPTPLYPIVPICYTWFLIWDFYNMDFCWGAPTPLLSYCSDLLYMVFYLGFYNIDFFVEVHRPLYTLLFQFAIHSLLVKILYKIYFVFMTHARHVRSSHIRMTFRFDSSSRYLWIHS